MARANPELREFILQNYIRQCKKQYAIAFLEWRLHFSKARRENASSTQQEDKEVQELIEMAQTVARKVPGPLSLLLLLIR